MAAAIVLAILATALRAQFLFFPQYSHPDEPIIGLLMYRTLQTGRASADWAGFADQDFSRPTYQFSPYTLLLETVASVCRSIGYWPVFLEDDVRLARIASAAFGGAAVLLAYFASLQFFNHVASALLAEAFLAFAFLHVQDSCYARVEAILSLVLLATLCAAGRAASPSGGVGWNMLTGFLAGFAVAVKYNAAPALVLIAAPLCGDRSQPGLWLRGVASVALALAAAVGGFLAGAPEALRDAAPLWAGIRFEAEHYAQGHIPHQAMDAADHNLGFWLDYFTRLGFGWVPTVFAAAFPMATLARGEPRRRLLSMYLGACAAMLICARVRFERNGEILLGAAALAAGATAVDLFEVWRRRWNGRIAATLLVGLCLWTFAESSTALLRFRRAQRRDGSPLLQLPPSVNRAGALKQKLIAAPAPGWNKRSVLIFEGYTDRFSAHALADLLPQLGDYDLTIYRSDWMRYGYPFSTVDVYHGPSFVLLAIRRERAEVENRPRK